MKRHRWVRVRDHFRVCRDCGTTKLSRPHPYERRWYVDWDLPDGTGRTTDGGGTPPCAPGPLTAERLRTHGVEAPDA